MAMGTANSPGSWVTCNDQSRSNIGESTNCASTNAVYNLGVKPHLAYWSREDYYVCNVYPTRAALTEIFYLPNHVTARS